MSECRPICEVASMYHLVETFIQYGLQLCEWIHIFSEEKKYSNWNESFHHWLPSEAYEIIIFLMILQQYMSQMVLILLSKYKWHVCHPFCLDDNLNGPFYKQ